MNNSKFKKAASMIIVMSVLLSILFLGRCTFEEPVAPTWDVLFNLPLLNKLFTMEDIAEDLNELSIDEVNQLVILSLEQEIETFEVGDLLKVDGVDQSITIPQGGSAIDSVGIPVDQVVLDSARIKSGNVHVEFDNYGTTAVTVHFEMSDLKDAASNPFVVDQVVPGNQNWQGDFPLDDFVFTPPTHSGQNFVRYEASLTGGNGDVDLDLDVSDLIFSMVSGKLDRMEVNIDSMESELGIPEEFEDFRIQSAELKLVLDLGLAFPVDVDLVIKGMEEGGAILDSIVIQQTILPSGTGSDTIEVLNLADFINSHPDEVLVAGKMILGDGTTPGTITDDHQIFASAFFQAPLILTVPTYETKLDVDTLEIDEDTQDIIRDNIKEARIVIEIENGLPLGFDVSVLLSVNKTDSTIFDQVTDTENLRFDLVLEPAPIDGNDPAVVTGNTSNTLEILLNEPKLNFFSENDTLYWGVMFEFQSADPVNNPMIQFRPQDEIEIQGYISALVNTTIPEEDDEEGGGS